MLWPPNISLEELKGVVEKSISQLDFRDFWMITWIDKIGTGDDGTPYFKASVHRVKSSDLSKFRVISLDLLKPQWITLPLRLLRIFPVGTLLKGGLVHFKSHHSFLTDYTIDLNTESGYENTTLGKWKYGEELIKYMSWGKLDSGYPRSDAKRFAFNSKILVYPNSFRKLAPYDYIVISKTELSRFYWFPSTRLFHELMDGNASSQLNNRLYVPESAIKKTDKNGEYHEILVRDRMHLRDVNFIARLAFSYEALLSANTIYQSVINSKLEHGNIGFLHLDCEFPFKDHTSLKVKGYTIRLASVTLLIVTELMQCYGPWPFNRLAYDRETPRAEIDDSLEMVGTKPVPSDKTEEKEGGDNDNDEEDVEDDFEDFILKRFPIVRPDRTFDNNQKNNNRTVDIEHIDKGFRFPTMPTNKWRLDRKRAAPPKNKREGDPTIIDNISTNKNTKSGGESTNIEVIQEEVPIRRKEVPLPTFIKKLTEEFKKRDAEVDFIVNVDGDTSESKWYQPELTSIIIPISDRVDVLVYLIYIRLAEKQYILCEMDRDTSTKIVLKKKLDNEKGIIAFRAEDVALIITAIKDNYRTLDQLNNTKSGLTVSRLYHVGDTTKDLCSRIISKMEAEGYKND